jgi:hypothetical protein
VLLDLHGGVVKAPVDNRRAKINADHSAFSVLSETTLPVSRGATGGTGSEKTDYRHRARTGYVDNPVEA